MRTEPTSKTNDVETASPTDTFLTVRCRIIDVIILILSAASVLTLLLSIPRHLEFGMKATGYLAYGVVVIFLLLTLFRSRLTFSFKATLLLCSAFTLGIVSLMDWGLSGMYAVYFMGTVFLTSLLLGFRSGLFFLIAALIMIILTALLVHTGMITHDIDYPRFFRAPATWMLAIAHIGLFAFVILIGFKRIHQSLLETIEQLYHRSLELTALNLRLRRSEQKYRLLADNATDMIWTLDNDLRTTFVSPQVFPLRGFTVEEAVTQQIEDIICDTSLSTVREALLSNADSKDETGPRAPQIITFEAEMICKNKKTVWTETCARVLLSQQGNPSTIIAVTRDITQRQQIEQERRTLQEQLTQSQKLESTGRLAGGVAHDFNNMLSAIIGYADLSLKYVPEGEKVHNNLIEIRHAAERSAEITRQLLAFARRQTAVPRTLDLNDTIDQMLQILHRLIGENIYLSWLPDPNIPPVRVDPSQLDQVLVNLCVNARDAIPDVGTITITTGIPSEEDIGMTFCEDSDNFVLLTVSDDGCGMPPETLEHIFEPFFTTKDTGKGAGLGLATVHGIITQNNGRIHVDSSTEKGTTFVIALPARWDEMADDISRTDALETIPGGNETILLVEDESTVLTITTDSLQSLGYNVLPASSPEEALHIVNTVASQIDLLITDVIMPGMNGRDLADEITRRRPDIRCLFMSGYTDDIIAHHGVVAPDVHFLQKPFTLLKLAKQARSALRR